MSTDQGGQERGTSTPVPCAPADAEADAEADVEAAVGPPVSCTETERWISYERRRRDLAARLLSLLTLLMAGMCSRSSSMPTHIFFRLLCRKDCAVVTTTFLGFRFVHKSV